MNWIKRDIDAQQTAVLKGPDSWKKLCACFADAVAYYTEKCSAEMSQARFDEQGNNASVTWEGRGDESRFCAMEFDPSTGIISFEYPDREPASLRGPLKLKVEADKRGAMHLLMDGKGITYDQCSELVLRWVLFGN